MKLIIAPLVLLLAIVPLGRAQESATPVPAQIDRGISRLETIIPALQLAENDLAAMRLRLKAAGTDEEKKEIAKEVDTQRERVNQLRENFQTLSTGVEESRYTSVAEASVSWQKNLEDIIAPLSNSIRSMTEGPRKTAEMRDELELWQDRKRLTDSALARLNELIKAAEGEAITTELERTRKLWANRQAEASSQIQVFSQQIEDRERTTPTAWQAISGGVAEFWRSRGLNLLIALVVAIAIYMGIRRGYRMLRKVSPLHKRASGLASRSADLISSLLASVFALLSAVLVFYLRGDWLLLTMALILILGLLWASKEALPPYLEQFRLILNIGPVRQGERLIYNGIPWRVDKLNFYCEFSNPDLTGGHLRLPIRDVMPMHSREADAKEPFFPTHTEDWVILGDGIYGKVVTQTPEQVVLLRLGGSRKTYPTADFLGEAPQNLSKGFRISVTFGIDYDHQEICTTVVPEIFQRVLHQKLSAAVERENLRSVKVEFSNAGASSLDYEILADFSGGVAMRMNTLRRLIQKTCVEVCNEQGWGIPFTQITVHQAVAPARADG